MKFTTRILTMLAITAFLFASCKKEESQVKYIDATKPVLTSSLASAGKIVLKEDNQLELAFKLNWTNPNYQFSTGVSSQPVNYTIEIDTSGSNFTNPDRSKVDISTDLSRNITIGDFNKYLVSNIKLKAEVEHNVEIRVVATLGSGGAMVVSNTIAYKVTPYPVVKIPLPSSGDLFLVGDASPGGWSNPVATPSQQFTKISSTKYQITIALNADKKFLLLPENGSWGKKYAVENDGLTDLWKGGELKLFTSGGKDIPGPPVSGNYTITVDFQEGIFTVVKI